MDLLSAGRMLAPSTMAIELLDAQKRQIVGEIHDDVGGLLVQLGWAIDELRPAVSPDAREQFEKVTVLLASLEAVTRRIIAGSAAPTGARLVDEIRRMLTTILSDRGVVTTFETAGDLSTLSPTVSSTAFQTVREAVVNVGRHSRARSMVVRLSMADSWLRVEIEDDGIGLRDDHLDSVGLQLMRDRIAMVGGKLRLGNGPGGGCRVRADLPCAPA
ncbi:MAG: hypothetical protein U0556_04540 [Dehalococcoidia bacterium]